MLLCCFRYRRLPGDKCVGGELEPVKQLCQYFRLKIDGSLVPEGHIVKVTPGTEFVIETEFKTALPSSKPM